MRKTENTKFYAVYTVECIRPDGKRRWKQKFRNLVPTVGKNKLLDATLKTGLAAPLWYVGLKNATAPAAGDTMASKGWTELTPYSNGTRPAFTPGTIAAGAVDNSASKASFTINATATVAGAFVADNNTKGGTTGTLLSAGNFAATKDVESGDTLNVTVTFTIT
jgi:hypothetical protein